jgi:WD40 repeat protein
MRACIALALILALSISGTAAGLSFDRAWETTMPENVLDIAISDDGRTIVVITAAALSCFDADGTPLWEVPGRHAETIGISGDGSLVVAGGEDLRLYDRSGALVFRHDTGFFAFGTAISPDGTCIAGGFDNTSMIVFRKNDTGAYEQSAIVRTSEDVISIALSLDGRQIVTGEQDGAVRYYTGEGRLLWSYATGSTALSCSTTGDGAYVAVGADHGVAELLNRNGRVLWRQVSGERRAAVGTSGDGSLLALGGNSITFFSTNGTRVGGIDGSIATSLAVAGSGPVAAGAGKTVALYRPASVTPTEDEAAAPTPAAAPERTGGEAPPTPAEATAPVLAGLAALLGARRQG